LKYSRFELLAMGVGVCAVVGSSFATVSGADMFPEIVGQALILLALWGGLHYGRKGAVVAFLICTSVYAIVVFSFMSSQLSIALEIFLLRTAVYGAVAFGAGELNAHLKYLFVKLENPDHVDGLTNLYNARYFSKLLNNKIIEFNASGQNFSLATLTISNALLAPLKKRVQNKLMKEIGNSVIRDNIRGVDEAARINDTRFMLLFPDTNLEDARVLTNRVSGKVRGYLDRHGMDTDREDTLETEVLEYPPNRDAIEKLALGLSETDSE